MKSIAWKDVKIYNISSDFRTKEQYVCISSNPKIIKKHIYWPETVTAPCLYKSMISLLADPSLISFCDEQLSKYGIEKTELEDPKFIKLRKKAEKKRDKFQFWS